MFEELNSLKLYSFIRTTYNKQYITSNIMHEHDYYQLLYGHQGNGAVCAGNKIYPISENGFVIVKCNEPHSIYAYSEKFKTFEIKFDFSEKQYDFLAECDRIYSEDRSGNIKKALRQMEFESELLDSKSYKIAVIELFKILELMRRECSYVNKSEAALGSSEIVEGNDEFFNKIKVYIDRNIDLNITILDISKEFHIEYKYLSRLFTSKYGIRLKQYINNRRIELAKETIANTDASMTKIAEKCGFSSLHQMERAFKNAEGISPSQYRQKYKHSNTVVFNKVPITHWVVNTE